MCDLVVLELVRLAPNDSRARATDSNSLCFGAVEMPGRVTDLDQRWFADGSLA